MGISKGMKKTGAFAKILAGFFSIAIVLALGFMGNAVQSNSIASGIKGIQGLENINPAIYRCSYCHFGCSNFHRWY